MDGITGFVPTSALKGFGMDHPAQRLMMVASSRLDVPLVFAGLITTGLMGIMLYWVAEFIERRTTGCATRSTEGQNFTPGG